MSGESWTDRLFGGLRKTSERLSDNLSGIVGQAREMAREVRSLPFFQVLQMPVRDLQML